MKKNIVLSLLLLFILCSACKTEKNKIMDIAYKYSFAMANYQIDEAEPYATIETQSTTLKKARILIEAIDEEYIKSDTPASIVITNVTIVDDTSAFAIYHKVTPIKDFSDTLDLRKRDGQWKAHAPIPIVSSSKSKIPIQTKNGKIIKEYPIKTK